jgi:hypothetical protein
MPKKTGVKPKYQAPVVMDLGKLARGAGAICSPGASPSLSGACKDGNSPSAACNSGGSATSCVMGSSG